MQSLLGWRRTKRRRSADRIEDYTTRIGIGFLLTGGLQGSGHYLVEGEVVGDGEVDGAVVLAAGAYWKGDLVADHVRVAGKVEGDVTARTKIELAPTAVVTGNLASPVIAIAAGAVYEGVINRPRKTRVTRFTERRGASA
jgi:cytoskeletal protein CcmA (bactofilin family)